MCPLYFGATYEKMSGSGYVPWLCLTEDSPGGKGLLFATELRPPMEQTDSDFPLVLSTGREVGHYSCRSMTGNCTALQTLADEPG